MHVEKRASYRFEPTGANGKRAREGLTQSHGPTQARRKTELATDLNPDKPIWTRERKRRVIASP